MLKAITLYEPYASLMAIGAKANETRPNRTAHRGDICIHAAKRRADFMSQPALMAFRNRNEPIVYHPGHIIAVVELWDVQPSEKFLVEGTETARANPGNHIVISSDENRFGNYAKGRFIYRTRNLRRLAKPVPCRGFQCVGWIVPPEVEALVRQQLPHSFLNLVCCSCGVPAPAFAQWWNRDDGYGICAACFLKWTAREGLEAAIQCCGKPGIHHSLNL